MDRSKSYYQFIDVGERGVIEIRRRSCHQCPGCMDLTNFAACVCGEIVGPIERVQLTVESEATNRVTRHALQEAGKALTTGLSAGTLVVIELTDESELFMIGVITKPKHTILVAVGVPEMGRLIPGDEVLEVRKFEVTQADSNRFILTEKVFPVRPRCPGPADFVDQGAPRCSCRNTGLATVVHGFALGHAYRLMPGALQHILQLVPDDADESALNARRVEL